MGQFDDLFFKDETPGTLLDFSKTNNYRVTSGYSAGGHNKGSKHYQGSASDPMAIDIDHRGVDYNKLLAQAQAAGYRVLDERTRPKGQAVWGGPHFHLEKMANAQPLQIPQSRVNTTQPVNPALPSTLAEPILPFTYQDGQMIPNPAYSNYTPPKLIEPKSLSATDVKQVSYKPNKPKSNKTGMFDHLLFEDKKPDTNFFGDFGAHLGNALTGYTQDDAIRNSGHGVGATLGDFAGGFGAIGAGAGSGALLGTAGFTPFSVGAGAIGGSVVGATTAGGLQEAQRERLAGEQVDPLKIGGSAAIQGVLQAVPVLKGSTLLRQLVKNAAIQGAGAAAGSVGQQGIEQGTITPKIDLGRTFNEGVLGAAGGTVGGYIDAKVTSPELNVPDSPNGFKRNLTRADGSTLDLPEPYQVNAQDLGNVQDMLSDMPNQFRHPDQVALELQGLERQAKQATSEAEFNALQPRIKQLREEVGRARAAQEPVTGRGIDLGEPRPKVDIELPEAKKQPELILPKESFESQLRRVADDPFIQGELIPNKRLVNSLDDVEVKPLLDAQGNPLKRNLDDIQLELGKRTDTSGQLEIPKRFFNEPVQVVDDVARQAVKQTDNPNVVITASGGEVFTQGRSVEEVNAMASKLQERLVKAEGQLATIDDIELMLKAKLKAGIIDQDSYTKQMDVLKLAIEAGENNKVFNATRRELKEGLGRVSKALGKNRVKNREALAVFAVSKQKIQPNTFVNNLKKELGSSEAVQARLRQIASEYGITPTTKTISRAKDQALNNAKYIAQQLREHPQAGLLFEDGYINLHNYQTGGVRTSTDAVRHYPLRTFESANVGIDDVSIPQAAQFSNELNQISQAVKTVLDHPSVPDKIKPVIENHLRGNITKNSRKAFRDLLEQSPDLVKQLCRIL